MNEQRPGFTIKIVAERTSVPIHTLRAWERRYGVPQPDRVPNNRYLLYDEQDIADVLWMKQQVESGISPAQAGVLFQQRKRSLPALAVQAQPIAETAVAFTSALLRSDEAKARQILDDAFAWFTPEQVCLQVIQPAMEEIGNGWQRQEIGVWQEHLASNLVRQKLQAVMQAQPVAAPAAPHVIAACAPAEEHELGLLIFALLLRRQGWHTSYLGQGTPLVDMVNLARTVRSHAIIVSVTTAPGLTSLIPWFEEANRPQGTLIFGGRILNLLPGLREHMPGAFLGEDTLAAARALGSIVSSPKFWRPTRRAWSAVLEFLFVRSKLTGDTVAHLLSETPAQVKRSTFAEPLTYATAYLADVLVCALAYDVPELVDLHLEWIAAALPPRMVAPQAIAKHLEIFERVLDKTLTPEAARQLKPLLARLGQK